MRTAQHRDSYCSRILLYIVTAVFGCNKAGPRAAIGLSVAMLKLN